MTSLIRSSITGLYHPKRRLDSIGSSLTDNQRMKTSAVDRILNADKSGEIYQLINRIIHLYFLGFLPTVSSINSSRSSSNLDLSNSSSIERSVLEAQIKRANSCNETMEASIKRLRTESQNSMDDLISKNEVKSSINHFFIILVLNSL